VSFGSATFYAHDLALVSLIFSFFVFALAIKRELSLPPVSILVLIFVLFALVSLVNSLHLFPFNQVLVGSLFLLRFVLYFFLYLIVANIVQKENVVFWLSVLLGVGFALAFLGFLQLVLFPDLSFLAAYGWDPHVGRLTSTFLDPNFVGLFLVFSFNLSLAMFYFKKNFGKFFLLFPLIFFIALILTFSRSSYLAWIVSLFSFGLFFSKRLLLFFLPLFLLSIIFLPRMAERISGAASLDITAQARVISWQNAVQIIKDNSLFGVGFNNYRFAQMQYGFFGFERPEGGMSGAGSDSSLLLVLATTGILGFVTFLTFLARIFSLSFTLKNSSVAALTVFSSLIALLVHSIFVNSIFYPWILAWFFITLGLMVVETS
jgi:O-antigen ligase